MSTARWRSLAGRALRATVRRPVGRVLQWAGRAYVPGGELADALHLARAQAAEGVPCTLGYFYAPGEALAGVERQTVASIDAVAGLQPKGYVSLKAPAYGYEPAAMTATLAHARELGVLAHFDSHDIGGTDATLACVEHALALGVAAGLTVPGRWPRSPDDAAWAVAAGVRVRVVKGEWADPEAPLHDAPAGFMDVIDRLAGCAGDVAVATHDPVLARRALQRLLVSGTRCELELLNGLPRRAVRAVAQELGVPTRLYIPFGIPWRPYALRKLGENPRIAWWLLHDAVLGLRQQWRGRR